MNDRETLFDSLHQIVRVSRETRESPGEASADDVLLGWL